MSDESTTSGRLLPLIAGGAVVVAAMGFLTGATPVVHPRVAIARSAIPAVAARAPSYGELREGRRGPNADMYVGAVDALGQGLPGALDPVLPQTEEDKASALARRSSRRAYDGAPPVIPHAIDQMGIPDCLTCHATGARVGEKVAPRMSHERHDLCTQCHVVNGDPRPVKETPAPRENAFVGAASPSRGARAWPGAPPTIPHSTWMRSECGSCHGVGGVAGIRSTHPWRQSCTQCHAPSAALDQRPRVN